MMYTMPKNLLSICVNFALATQQKTSVFLKAAARQRAYNKNREAISKNRGRVPRFFDFWRENVSA